MAAEPLDPGTEAAIEVLAAHLNGDHSLCDPQLCAVLNPERVLHPWRDLHWTVTIATETGGAAVIGVTAPDDAAAAQAARDLLGPGATVTHVVELAPRARRTSDADLDAATGVVISQAFGVAVTGPGAGGES